MELSGSLIFFENLFYKVIQLIVFENQFDKNSILRKFIQLFFSFKIVWLYKTNIGFPLNVERIRNEMKKLSV